jgi:FkbM family methyltransferase
MKPISKMAYYAVSIVTLLTRFERPFQILAIFLGQKRLPAEVKLRRSGLRFSVREAMDVWVIKETCVDADYLPPGGFQPDWQVVDIGAGLGDFSVFAAVNCPAGMVYAYEPLGRSFELLKHNLGLNQVRNVEAYQQATAAVGGTMLAVLEETEAVSTRFVSQEGDRTATIPAITLGEILERLPDGRCDLMKIDCEGCEFDLLLNSPPELLERIERLTIETHDDFTDFSANQLAVYLRECGFEVHQKGNPVHSYLGFIYAERS